MKKINHTPYDSPTGGWGSVRSVASHALTQRALPAAARLLPAHNKTGGYRCTSCAWTTGKKPHFGEFCENGAKATFWDLTARRTGPEFFARHSVSELLSWSDYELEKQGRLTHPMRYDAATDRYVPVEWDAAFAEIGARLKGYEDPKSVIFYASGRAALETSYMYALFARLYGNNNLPDSSNMCHETTSVALAESIGTPVGTVLYEDFEKADCILSFGQNVGTNAPRLLHPLQKLRERGAPIVVFNPLRERGWESFVNPQRPGEMLTNNDTKIATQYYQPRPGGDIAAIMGMAKALFAWDDAARAAGNDRVLDAEFIARHTEGFEAFEARARGTSWDEIERESGLHRSAIEAAARTYADAERVIAIYGMGLTQHRGAVDNVQMLVNLMLMRGNIGKPGAGMCPVRGHSNVQGQRTVGIAERAELVPLDLLAELYGFEPPREDGMNTVEACEGMVEGMVDAFIGLGGNFLRAIPDSKVMEEAWRGMDLSVQIATKLNRTHLITARSTWLLPCLVRSEIDEQATGPQIVSTEDSTTCIHASRGVAKPASEHLLSEPAIVARMAMAALVPNPRVPWQAWMDNYALVRDAIERTYPKAFRDFNARLDTPGGFPRPIGAREREWETDSGKAMFMLPDGLCASFDDGQDADVLRMMTLRSNDQFNTTVYGLNDRLRGLKGSREIVLMNRDDMLRLGIEADGPVSITTAADDGILRRVSGFQAIAYDVPPGSCASYFPECNVLVPLWQYAQGSMTPASKSVPVRIAAEAPRHAG